MYWEDGNLTSGSLPPPLPSDYPGSIVVWGKIGRDDNGITRLDILKGLKVRLCVWGAAGHPWSLPHVQCATVSWSPRGMQCATCAGQAGRAGRCMAALPTGVC